MAKSHDSFGVSLNPRTLVSDASGTDSGALTIPQFARLAESYLLTCDVAGHSTATVRGRRSRFDCLLWWAQEKNVETIDVHSLRAFLSYLRRGHTESEGRFGGGASGRLVGESVARREVSSGTLKTYHAVLRAFFNWVVDEGALAVSPMVRIPTPVDRPDQPEPFTPEQLAALETAIRRPQAAGRSGRRIAQVRDVALFLILLDTGIRASELCGLRVADVDMDSSPSSIRVRMGKGGKARTIPISSHTKRALYTYLQRRELAPDQPLFVSLSGTTAGDALKTNGLERIVRKWGTEAGIQGVRVSPHTFRHSMAVMFLRAGGNVFTLKELLGHTTLTITNRYVALAQADIARQHAQFSPVASLRGQQGAQTGSRRLRSRSPGGTG